MSAAPRFQLQPLRAEALRERTVEVEARLSALPGGASVLARVDPYCRALRTAPADWPYLRMPPSVLDMRDALAHEGGTRAVAAFHRCVLLRLVPASWAALRERAHLRPSLAWFEDAVARMLGDLVASPDDTLDFHADPFVKDLGVVTLRLLALGAVTIEPRLRLPRRWIVQGGMRNLAAGATALARLGGSFPLYEMHAYHRHLAEFTEPGWEAMYRRMAAIMVREPDVRGLYGGTWFWDPALETVSPRLAYLRRLPLAHGAVFARIPTVPDTYENALATSETRRRLHAEGKYEPRQFIMVWPRRAFLRWAGEA